MKNPNISLAAKLLLVPVVGLIRLAGFGRHFRLDMIFAVVVAAVPLLIAMKAFE